MEALFSTSECMISDLLWQEVQEIFGIRVHDFLSLASKLAAWPSQI
jgi:hypothetical protein